MFRLVFWAFLAAVAAGIAPPAFAQPRRAPDVQPLDRVLPQVRRHYPGTFYDADGPFMDESGNPHYRLKWMTPEGRVIWLDTDARSGRVLGVERAAPRGGHAMPPPDMRAPPPDMRGPPPGYFDGPRRGQFDDASPDHGYRENRGWNNGRGRQNGNGWHGGGGHGGGGHGGGHGHGHGG